MRTASYPPVGKGRRLLLQKKISLNFFQQKPPVFLNAAKKIAFIQHFPFLTVYHSS
jgi:hypothetical protein